MPSFYLEPDANLANTYTINLDYANSQVYNSFYNQIKSEIFNYVTRHFKPYSMDEPSYGCTFVNLQQEIYTNRSIQDVFTSIMSLSPDDYKYGRAFYPSSTSITFYKVTPSTDEFNKEVASNYFDVDEVWRDELRGTV